VKTLECRLFLHRQHVFRVRAHRELIVALEIVHLDIVLVNPVTSLDWAAGKTDDLSEFYDRLALGDRARSYLVAEWNTLARRQAGGDRKLLVDLFGRDEDIVLAAQP
jgi:hypothetical protein